jgi:serine/threonine protein kinase
LEYKQGINLETMIFSQGYAFTRNEIYNMVKQLIDILKYLHGEGVVHRDIGYQIYYLMIIASIKSLWQTKKGIKIYVKWKWILKKCLLIKL